MNDLFYLFIFKKEKLADGGIQKMDFKINGGDFPQTIHVGGVTLKLVSYLISKQLLIFSPYAIPFHRF